MLFWFCTLPPYEKFVFSEIKNTRFTTAALVSQGCMRSTVSLSSAHLA